MDARYFWKGAKYLGAWCQPYLFEECCPCLCFKGKELLEKWVVKAYLWKIFCKIMEYNYVFKIDFSQMHTLHFIAHEFKASWSWKYRSFLCVTAPERCAHPPHGSADPAETFTRGNMPRLARPHRVTASAHRLRLSADLTLSITNRKFCLLCFWPLNMFLSHSIKCVLRSLRYLLVPLDMGSTNKSCPTYKSWWATTRSVWLIWNLNEPHSYSPWRTRLSLEQLMGARKGSWLGAV